MRFTAMNRARRGKMALTAGALAVGLLTVSGCGYITPQQTTAQYAASDGIVANLGPLKLSNFMVISAGAEQPGRVLGAVYNSSSQPVTLTVRGAEGSQTQVPVPANSYTLLNDSSDEAILSTTGGPAGSLVDLQISENGTNVSETVKVPVLDTTLEEYKGYLPAGSTMAPTPTASESAAATGH